jgi:hypothetical protein
MLCASGTMNLSTVGNSTQPATTETKINMNKPITRKMTRKMSTGVTTIVTAALILGISTANAKSTKAATRLVKSNGLCVTVPVALFPNQPIVKAAGSAEFEDEGSAPGTVLTAKPKRDIWISSYPSFSGLRESEKPGFVTEYVHVDSVTDGDGEYAVKGYWVEDLSDDSGPWRRRAFLNADSTASYVDFTFMTGDYKKHRKAIEQMIASTRRCN